MVKVEYIGDDGRKDLDLVINGVFSKDDVLVKGTVFEVPDDNILLIRSLKVNGNYRVFQVGKTTGNRGRKRKRR